MNFNLRIDITRDLKNALKWGKRYVFLEDHKVTRSKVYALKNCTNGDARKETLRCMIFEKPKEMASHEI